MKTIFFRSMLLLGFTLLALVLFLPSTPLGKSLPGFWADNVPKIVLGLDLQGGTHLVLDVDQDKAVSHHIDSMKRSLETAMREKGLAYGQIMREGDAITVSFEDKDAAAAIKDVATNQFPLSASAGANKITFTLTVDEVKTIKEWATTQALETIRNRIDKFGVAEPHIQRQGEREIIVQLPGLKDPSRAIALIGKTAVLEFRMLDETGDPVAAEQYGAPFGTELMYQIITDKETGGTRKIPYLVKKEAPITGDSLSDARVAFDSQFNEPYVAFTFNSAGARTFQKLTADNVGKRLAIILDGSVYSAPVIREEIGGGRGSITGGFSHDEATDLAIVLRAGALPAPVSIIQNVTVGPTLGKDSIEAGIKAIIIGAILVLVFMLVYYKGSGLIADIAIVLNVVMLLGAMAWVNATLTLPGIAGILLTIGMGVDSNVLIFERIKEELRGGRTPRSALHAGYDRAWWTVIDSHITTLITAAVLFQFGSGPIKGFAVSLSLGIIINLFTALVGTKLAFDIQSDKFKVERFSI